HLADLVHRYAHGELCRVVGARSLDQLILRRRAAAAGGPFLQRALGMLGPSCAALHRLQPDRADKLACGAEAALDETGAEQRFHHVAEDIVAVGPAVAARLLAEADMRRQADVA